MGSLENQTRKRRKRENVKKAILQTVSAVGLLSVALMAPNLIKIVGPELRRSRLFSSTVNRSRRELVRAGLLKYSENGYLTLTSKGEAKLRQLELADYKQKIPKKRDRRWRMIIFDISDKRRGLRDKVRQTLTKIGFMRLQNSVWVYPYDCEDLMTLLKADFQIGKAMLYVITDSIEYDKNLKSHFGLT